MNICVAEDLCSTHNVKRKDVRVDVYHHRLDHVDGAHRLNKKLLPYKELLQLLKREEVTRNDQMALRSSKRYRDRVSRRMA